MKQSTIHSTLTAANSDAYSECERMDMLDHARKLALNVDENTSTERLKELLNKATPI